ncbi:uncharacterized protein EDB91DRAFT_1166434 [Suillus paluster]|uniref:uncharacterized protein n=1 Tax=Suillus paluster TaxID=48578 RepID=UPI001B87583E|nr:uncharacterized protein EDB91DRAFT_1166434 [Suillus paluster]KAG1726259.1 hypothetical protein EDB91DRAFT_1166434 [Suillus paluster]
MASVGPSISSSLLALIALLQHTPDQRVVDQGVLDNDIYRVFVNPSSSLPCANDIMSPSKLVRSSTICPNYGFTAPHLTIVSNPNHPAEPTFPGAPSRALAIPQPQSVYPVFYPTNMFTSVSNHGASQNLPSFHNTQYYNPVLGGTIVRRSSPSAMGSDYSSSYTLQMPYPDVCLSRPTFPSEYTNHDTPFVFDPEMSTSHFSGYNELLYQWQNSIIPQPRPPSGPSTPVILPPLAAEFSQINFTSQPCASHGRNASYPSDQPPINQPYPITLHSHPSSPLLLSCRWLQDDTLCVFTGTLEALKAHCKTSHFAGPPNAQIECRWEACGYHKRDCPTVHAMRRDCMWRHTSEVHLGMKRGT